MHFIGNVPFFNIQSCDSDTLYMFAIFMTKHIMFAM